MTIIAFKLSNGEEIIGRSIHVDETKPILSQLKIHSTISIESPRVMGLQEGKDGVSLGMMPWLLSNPGADVEVSTDNIATACIPDSKIEKGYMSQTSKIQLL